MPKEPKPHKKHIGLYLSLLAILCIVIVELIACYFFAPALFEKVTAPARNAAYAAVSFVQETAAELHADLQETAANCADFFAALAAPETPPHDSQTADGVLYTTDKNTADPSVTELKLKNGREILTGGMMDLAYFNQTDECWADKPYGSDDIGRYGCGPTVMAMVINSFTDHETDPVKMAQWAVDNRYWAQKSGSYLSLIQGASRAFGLKATPISEKTADAVETELLSGNLIVALMGPGHFTKSGHFMILHGITLNGSVLVADPNSVENSLVEWDMQLILSELSASTHNGAPLWVISRVPN